MSPSLAAHAPDPGAQSPEDGEPRLERGQIVLLALTVLIARMVAARAFPIYDDAFITYRYARNFAHGLGLVYNPGAAWEPILGTTTPGYAVILAGLNALGLPILTTSLALNFLCDAFSAVLLIHLLDRKAVSSLFAVLAFASIPEIARISAGGMEPPLVVLCCLASVLFFHQGRLFAAGTASAIACTVRPECPLLVVTLAVLVIARRQSLVRFLTPVVIIGAITMGLLTWYYGSFISQSITAKIAVHGGEQHAGFSRRPDILAQAFGPSTAMRCLAAVVALGALMMIRLRSRITPFAIFSMLIVAAYLVERPKTWGWYFYAPLTVWIVWLGLGFEQIARWIGFERLRSSRSVVRWSTAAGCVASVAAVACFPLIRADKVTPLVYEHFETWAKEARVEERQATILASDIGAIGWYANTRILDSAGLVWPEALEFPRQVDQIRKYLPDYAILVVRRSRLKPFRVDEPELAAKYEPIRRFNEFNKTGLDKLDPPITELPDWWEQDYILYERVTPAEK
ncbi:MAG TPA: hypothetical protein VM509_03765 [Planctomycetota bacterium]|nr:hypothetical protein [Planctomycetota bacterium]